MPRLVTRGVHTELVETVPDSAMINIKDLLSLDCVEVWIQSPWPESPSPEDRSSQSPLLIPTIGEEKNMEVIDARL